MAYQAKEITFDGQLGKVYNNLQLMTKFELPYAVPISFRVIGSISTFDYFKKEKIFSHNSTPAFNQKDESFIKLMATLPFLTNNRAEFGVGYGLLRDKYFQTNIINFNNDYSDMRTCTRPVRCRPSPNIWARPERRPTYHEVIITTDNLNYFF